MSIEELISLLSQNKLYVGTFLICLPMLTLILSSMHSKYMGKQPPWKYFYSVVIYLACIPGIFSLVITVYSLIFLHVNLLTLDINVYFLPLVSMALTLYIVRKSVTFDKIPGFDKIYGLMILLALTLIIVIVLEKLRVFVLFRGSIFLLFIAVVAVFFMLKYSMKLIFGSKKRNSV